jgi:Holliday junction resolvase RusA-like endonuclease
MTVDPVLFKVDGPVRGKGRPRFVRATGRTYTPAETTSAEERVRQAWREAGAPDYGHNPIRLNVTVVLERPTGHRRTNGELSAAGLRSVYPTKKPDLDNVLKLVADALNKCAYADDAQVVDADLSRRWATREQHDHVLVFIAPLGVVVESLRAVA